MVINRDIEGVEVLYFDKTNEVYDLGSFHIYDGEVDWSDENGTLKPDISQRVINKISLLGKEEASQQNNKDVRFRNIESIKDRNRQVLRIDEYGKNIVWENGDYYIAVDSKDDATYISLWNDNKKIGFLTAQKA